jgi:phosphoribosylglycinamide formyltransferase-1
MLVSHPPKRIAVLVSGGGTNLQAILDAQEADQLGGGQIVCVIADRADVFALVRAERAGIGVRVVERKAYSSTEDFNEALLGALEECEAELVVLAGFLSILSKRIIDAFPNRIVNVHPSLIPSFCGTGFYGLKVHREALNYGVKITGATVHLVNEVTDGGRILMQKAVDVLKEDTPESLQKRVMEQAEWVILPQAISLLCRGEIQ